MLPLNLHPSNLASIQTYLMFLVCIKCLFSKRWERWPLVGLSMFDLDIQNIPVTFGVFIFKYKKKIWNTFFVTIFTVFASIGPFIERFKMFCFSFLFFWSCNYTVAYYLNITSQQTFTCSKWIIETLDKCVKKVQS